MGRPKLEFRFGRDIYNTGILTTDSYLILLATGRWFSPGPPVSSTNKTDHHDIHVTEILLIVSLNTIKQTNILN